MTTSWGNSTRRTVKAGDGACSRDRTAPCDRCGAYRMTTCRRMLGYRATRSPSGGHSGPACRACGTNRTLGGCWDRTAGSRGYSADRGSSCQGRLCDGAPCRRYRAACYRRRTACRRHRATSGSQWATSRSQRATWCSQRPAICNGPQSSRWNSSSYRACCERIPGNARSGRPARRARGCGGHSRSRSCSGLYHDIIFNSK